MLADKFQYKAHIQNIIFELGGYPLDEYMQKRVLLPSYITLSNNTTFNAEYTRVLSIMAKLVDIIPKDMPIRKNEIAIKEIIQQKHIRLYSQSIPITFRIINNPIVEYDMPILFYNGNLWLKTMQEAYRIAPHLINNKSLSKYLISTTEYGYYEGMPTMAITSLSVELPYSIYTLYDTDTIHNILNKYVAAGTHVVDLYYNVDNIQNYTNKLWI